MKRIFPTRGPGPVNRRRWFRPAATVGFAVLSGALAIHGAMQYRDAAGQEASERSRDNAVAAVVRVLDAERRTLQQQVRSPAVRAAVTRGSWAEAGKALSQGWSGASRAQVFPADLMDAYVSLSPGEYGVVAAAEAALEQNRLTVSFVRTPKGPAVALAAPVPASTEGPAAVAYVEAPWAPIRTALAAVPVEASHRLVLRQGAFEAFAHGPLELDSVADAAAAPIPGTRWRVGAAAPAPTAGLFGGGPLSTWAAAALALVLAAVASGRMRWRWRRTSDTLTSEPFAVGSSESTPPGDSHAGDAAAPAPIVSPAPPRRARLGVGVGPGQIPADVDARTATALGLGLGRLLAEQGVTDLVVGRDERPASQALMEGLVAGLRAAGRRVFDVGQAPSPHVRFAALHWRAGTSVAVGGAPGPDREATGLDVVAASRPWGDAERAGLLARARELIENGDTGFEGPAVESRSIESDYLIRLAETGCLARPMRVAVSGPGLDALVAALAAIGAEVVPEGQPAEAAVALSDNGAALIAWDAEGRRLPAETMAGAILAETLQRHPAADVLLGGECDTALAAHVIRAGGDVLTGAMGAAAVREMFRDSDALMAADGEGHIWSRDGWYGFPDGIFAVTRWLQVLQNGERMGPTPCVRETWLTPNPGQSATWMSRLLQSVPTGWTVRERESWRADGPDAWAAVWAVGPNTWRLRVGATSSDALERAWAIVGETLAQVDPALAPN